MSWRNLPEKVYGIEVQTKVTMFIECHVIFLIVLTCLWQNVPIHPQSEEAFLHSV